MTDPADAMITRGRVAIAHGLGLEVTAEDIEDREQLAMLHEFGVQHMQGYLFAKPMAADVFMEMLVRGAGAWLQAIIDP